MGFELHIDGVKAKHKVPGLSCTAVEEITFGSGSMSFQCPMEYFNFLEPGRPAELVVDGETMWEGIIERPSLDLARRLAGCCGKNHTIKLTWSQIDREYWYKDAGRIVEDIAASLGLKSEVEASSIYENDFSKSMEGFVEQTDAAWNLEDGEYSGEDTDLDKTIYGNGSSLDDYMVEFDIAPQSGSDYGVYIRYQDDTHYYRIQLGPTCKAYVNNGSGEVFLGNIPVSGWDSVKTNVRVHVKDNIFTIAFSEGVGFGQFRDTTLDRGTFGFYVNNSHAHFDNLRVFPDGSVVYHVHFKDISPFDALTEIRKLKFVDVTPWDFWLDKDDRLHFKPRRQTDYVMELREGDNILGGTLYLDTETRNKVKIYGTKIHTTFPRTNLYQFTQGMAGSWEKDSSWYEWYDTGSAIHCSVLSEQSSNYALFPKEPGARNWGLDAGDYKRIHITLDKDNAATNWGFYLRAYKDGSTYQDFYISGGNVGWDPIDFVFDLSIDTVNYIGVRLIVGTLSGFDRASVNFQKIYFERLEDDVEIVAYNGEIPEKVYEETNLHLESFERGSQYARALQSLLSEPRWKGTLTVRGSPLARAGNNVRVVVESAGFDKVMRITRVTHSLGSQGWTSTLELDEEETLLAKRLKEHSNAIYELRNRDMPTSYITKEV
jgi:hypothetical protein